MTPTEVWSPCKSPCNIFASACLRKVVPAAETTEGVLCIELRIKMHHDGAMSKLLEKLSKVHKENNVETVRRTR